MAINYSSDYHGSRTKYKKKKKRKTNYGEKCLTMKMYLPKYKVFGLVS